MKHVIPRTVGHSYPTSKGLQNDSIQSLHSLPEDLFSGIIACDLELVKILLKQSLSGITCGVHFHVIQV